MAPYNLMKFLAGCVACLWVVGPLAQSVSAAEPERCNGKANQFAGDSTGSLVSGGIERTYRVHVPPSYSPLARMPVVLVFHGGLGTGKYIEKQSRMAPVSDANGFLAVFPDGLKTTWNAGGCCEYAMRANIDDVGFVSNLIDKIEQDYCVDDRRIYATGFSNGAMMAHRLACELSERIAAIAPVSGVVMVSSCTPKRRVPVLVFHGTADPRSLWAGGLGDKDPRKGVRDSIPRTMDTLSTRNGCSSTSTEFLKQGAVTCTRRPGCGDDAEVGLCRIEGGGHQWPGGEAVWPGRLGPANQDISAAQVMWDFFKRHTLPAR